MADKAPCRWLRVMREGVWFDCGHPIMDYHCMGRSDEAQEGLCHGCPCHEPEAAKDTTQKGDGDAVATD